MEAHLRLHRGYRRGARVGVAIAQSVRGNGGRRGPFEREPRATIGASLFGATLLILAASLCGCSRVAEQPEINPDREAPAAAERQWTPALAIRAAHTPPAPRAPREIAAEHRYSLAELIDEALRYNPRTHQAWESARAAAARYGSARAPYYPTVSLEAINGYSRTLFPDTGSPAVIKEWQSTPLAHLTYTLIDFGRRGSQARLARERLIASNFRFNRRIQDVVFAVQRSFYALGAAHSAVTAARKNLELARSDADAAEQRMRLGLATEPQLLLARQQVAQSQFDLASAMLLVRDAQADLAVAIGVPADAPIEVENLAHQAIPAALPDTVQTLIARAVRMRPDLAAQVADVRASSAALSFARAQWYPQLDVTGDYDEQIWNYSFRGPPTLRSVAPEYSAFMTLRWDLFTGFKRLNDVRAVRAEKMAAREGMRAAEIDSIAQVWRAYYQVKASRKRYDFARALLAASHDAYEANRDTYRQGLSTIVELLTATRDLASARYTLIQSQADLLTSYAAVANALGAVRPR